ncbi:unnamed protein product [Polarella glacialis]|uniref:Photolyase/cryptochrome alpha/beta domain-containing protein n=1 Tax=Polarella glacialis TaxID=89957 RepID=A0A813FUM4_POLGL|nr:unnamed protein product [Polarella glacialis]
MTCAFRQGFVRGVCMSPDGRRAFSCGDDKAAKMWKVNHRNCTLSEEPEVTYQVAYIPGAIDHHWNKPMFVTVGDTVDVWDYNRSAPLSSFEWGCERVITAKFNPAEPALIASTAVDRSIGLYDLRGNSAIRKVVLKMRSNGVCWNPMRPMNFTVANEDCSLYSFDMRKLTAATYRHWDHVMAVLDVNYSPTGQEFVSASYDNTVRIWNFDSQRSREVYHGKRMGRVLCCHFTQDSRFVLSGSEDTNIRVWKAKSDQKLGMQTPREKRSEAYRETLKTKFSKMPEISRIKRHRHVPKMVKTVSEKRRIIRESKGRKEENRRKHSKPGSFVHEPMKKRHILKEERLCSFQEQPAGGSTIERRFPEQAAVAQIDHECFEVFAQIYLELDASGAIIYDLPKGSLERRGSVDFAPSECSPFASALLRGMPPKQSSSGGTAVVWFRKCLRLHDNAALVEASKAGVKNLCPIYVIDPHFGPAHVGINRYNFLLEALQDLDAQLRKRHSPTAWMSVVSVTCLCLSVMKRCQLIYSAASVFRGVSKWLPALDVHGMAGTLRPIVVLVAHFIKNLSKAQPSMILWERDTEPYALPRAQMLRDASISKLAEKNGVEVRTFAGHTLYDVELALQANKGKAPTSMPGMVSLVKVLGEPQAALDVPKTVPPLPSGLAAKDFTVPSLKEMGYKVGKSGGPEPHCGFPGGETAGLARLEAKLKDKNFILNFQKPKTKSTAFDPPSTTVLSPYLKFGCVSVRQFYHGVQKVCAGKKHTPPPESLVGQLLFREMSYMMGASIPNFDRQVGNPSCKQIPWAKDAKLLEAWETGRTGYPFIDAVMRQLVQVGWIHHLARHAVSCFLTRGDLWLSWEQGRDVFDRHLLDSDWAVNNMNWLSLSGAAPWSPPFFRVYSPTPSNDSSLNVQDPEGKYVRQFVPELAKMPSKYIYAPWTAPLEVQKAAGCIIGKDYPKPVVDHKTASAANIAKFKEALSSGKSSPAVAQKNSAGASAQAKPSAADKAAAAKRKLFGGSSPDAKKAKKG